MILTIESVLSLFVLLTISAATYFITNKFRLPYTVMLVAVGLLLVPIAELSQFEFLTSFVLTKELLFYIFLPTLIFESAYNINIRHFVEDKLAITMLAVVSLAISAVFIGGVLWFIFSMMGMQIPFMVLFIFGALISATDPVAVLALFKEYGAPRRLTLLFEGESLMNDGTAVALFLVLVALASAGSFDPSLAINGALSFISMVLGGIAFGIAAGALFSKAIEKVRAYEPVAITLMIVSAHLTFIVTEIISEHAGASGGIFKISAIIATTFAAMVIGNYGRTKVSPHAGEFVEKFFGQVAFIFNSLIFILIGLIFASLPVSFGAMVVPIVITVVVVATGRALSIYPVIGLINKTKFTERIPRKWQHLLAWGSLRGALAITMVFLIPDSLTFAGWDYLFTPKEFIMGLTIGCIYATLFIKAPVIGPMIRSWKLDALVPSEEIQECVGNALVHARVIERISEFKNKEYIDEPTFDALFKKHNTDFREACEKCHDLVAKQKDLGYTVLRLYALGVEKHFLKELFSYGEVAENVFKKINTKLTLQQEQIEHGNFDVAVSYADDKKDIFESLARFVRRILSPQRAEESDIDRYSYYRAQMIISRKVIKELNALEKILPGDIFNDYLERVCVLYKEFKTGSEHKMRAVAENIPAHVALLNHELVTHGLLKTEESVIEDLFEKEMITQKLKVVLTNKFEHS